ncbi:MAG: hypothetical protein GY776_02205 [Alteromonas sp.]|nr:hypothetical protein [Alteromonas sp.]
MPDQTADGNIQSPLVQLLSKQEIIAHIASYFYPPEAQYAAFYESIVTPTLSRSETAPKSTVFPSLDTLRSRINETHTQEAKALFLLTDLLGLLGWLSRLATDIQVVECVHHSDKLATLFSDYPRSTDMALDHMTPRALFTLMHRGYGANHMLNIGPRFLTLLRQFTEDMITYLPQAMKPGPEKYLQFSFLDHMHLEYQDRIPPGVLRYSKLIFKDNSDPRHSGRERNFEAHLEILLAQQNTLQGLLLSTPEGLFDAVSHSDYITTDIISTLIKNPYHPYFSKLRDNHLFDMLKEKTICGRIRTFLRNPILVERFTGAQLVKLMTAEEEIIKEFMRNPDNVARLTGAEWVKLLGAKKEAIVQFLEYQDALGQFSNILKLHDGTIDHDKLERQKRCYNDWYAECSLAGQSGISKAVVLDQLRCPKKVKDIIEYTIWLCNSL